MEFKIINTQLSKVTLLLNMDESNELLNRLIQQQKRITKYII